MCNATLMNLITQILFKRRMNSRFFRHRLPKYALLVIVLWALVWIYLGILDSLQVNNAHIAAAVEDILRHVDFDVKPVVKSDVVETICRQGNKKKESEEPLCQVRSFDHIFDLSGKRR